MKKIKKFFGAPELREEEWYELLITPTTPRLPLDETGKKEKIIPDHSIGIFKTRGEAMFISSRTPKIGPSLLRPTLVITDGTKGILVHKEGEIFPTEVKKKYGEEYEKFLKELAAVS